MLVHMMKRYMFHLQNKVRYGSKDATIILYKARKLIEPEISIRDARISSKYIELDASVDEDIDIKSIIERVESIAPLVSYAEIKDHHMEKDKAIERAVQLFNDERYWEAHEVLEQVWKSARGTEKEILNGIILVAAAFVHDEKNEQDICVSILQRARRKFEGASGRYYEIDIDAIQDKISEIINSHNIRRFTI
jgi:predicted metal-dependent hydrolase